MRTLTKPKIITNLHVFAWQHVAITEIAYNNDQKLNAVYIAIFQNKKLKKDIDIKTIKKDIPEPAKTVYQLRYDPDIIDMLKIAPEDRPLSQQLRERISKWLSN